MMRLPHPAYATFSVADGVVALRAWSRDDAAFIVEASTDPAIQRYSVAHDPRGHPGAPPSIADASTTIDDFTANWRAAETSGALTGVGFAIIEAASNDVVGQCGIDEWTTEEVAQIGYWLAPAARGRGYATRAVRLLTSWLFEHGAARTFMTIVADNDASAAVALRAGFSHEGTMRDHGVWRDHRCDVMWFAALRDEWPPQREGHPGSPR